MRQSRRHFRTRLLRFEFAEQRLMLAGPAVDWESPMKAGVGVAVGAKVAAAFNAAVSPATITTTSIQLCDPSHHPVPGVVSYNAASRTATFDPDMPLAYATTYVVTIRGGSGGIRDELGNAMDRDYTWSFTTAAPPEEGTGGPILIVTTPSNPFSSYYAEILRAEGLNEFGTADVSEVSATLLSSYDVVILGEMPLTQIQVAMFRDWVNGGGDLIAMRPDKQLAGLLGLADTGRRLSNRYLAVNTVSGPGVGIARQAVQFHGAADIYALDGAVSLATLYAKPKSATRNPAVTLRSVGTQGGQAAAFTFDLARSVVYTRQGNPAWAGGHRIGAPPTRAVDMFFGSADSDPKPDWIDLGRVAVPQADEQQRLLANLIIQMALDRMPLPRFWYFPDGAKAMVLMTGDDHARGGTAPRFDAYAAAGQSGGQEIRSTSYVFPSGLLSDAQAASYTADGFEVGLHVNTNSRDWTSFAQLDSAFTTQLDRFQAQYPSLPSPSSVRTHYVVWSDWDSQPKVEFAHRIRLDTNYYYWPGAWIANRPGMFTGSGMPMRFASENGTTIDVYQAATQMTDESGQAYPFTINTLLDRAMGPSGWYGVFTANAHTNVAASRVSDAIVASAKSRGVPIVSGRQLLAWIDGRNGSSFGALAWNDTENALTFTVTTADGATGLQSMLPVYSAVGPLMEIRWNGAPVSYATQTIKGIAYACFPAVAGSYTALYAHSLPPTLSIDSVSPREGNSGRTTFLFTVTLSSTSDRPVAVNYATQNGSAAAGSDFVATGGALIFQPGQTQKTVAVAVKGDGLFEDDEAFWVNLCAPTGARVDPHAASGTGTIKNDDTMPTVSINSVSVKEGGPATTAAARFTLTLSAASGRPTTLSYATLDGTATIADNDYLATSGIVTFAPGETKKTLRIVVNGDARYEGNESFVVILGAPDGATISRGKGVGTGTIRNDDAPPPSPRKLTRAICKTILVDRSEVIDAVKGALAFHEKKVGREE